MVDEKYPIHGKITFVFPDCCPIWFAGRPADEDEYPSIEGSRRWGMADECGRAVVADECPIFSFGRPARPHTHLFKFFFFVAKSSLINTLNHFTLTNIHYFFGIILPPTLDSPLVQFHHFWGAPGNQNSGEPKNLGAPGKPKNLGST